MQARVNGAWRARRGERGRKGGLNKGEDVDVDVERQVQDEEEKQEDALQEVEGTWYETFRGRGYGTLSP